MQGGTNRTTPKKLKIQAKILKGDYQLVITLCVRFLNLINCYLLPLVFLREINPLYAITKPTLNNAPPIMSVIQ